MKGSITRRGKASWRIKFDLPAGPNGERRTQRITVRGGKKDAQAKLAELLASVGAGGYVEPSQLTIAAHCAARIDVWHAGGKIGDATRSRYGVLLAKQIAPHIGPVQLQRLSTDHIEAWHAKLRTSGLSARTARHAHVLLAKALGDAVRHSRLARNVAGRDGERAPTVPAKEMRILKKDQIDDVVTKLRGTEIFPQAMLALFCGLRAGEVLALRWSVIDLEGRTLTVRASVKEVAGQPLRIKAPKTDAGVRTLTLPAVVVEALQAHRRQQLEQRMALGMGRPSPDGLVFPSFTGGPSRRTALSIRWGETAAALGIPEITFHSLRHCHASVLIRARLDLATIAARMGHANPAVTLRTYAHLLEENDVAAAEAIDAAFGPNSGPKHADKPINIDSNMGREDP